MKQSRGHWGSGMGFVLAAAGSAIGLGNLWKFPYITWHNDGGAFVLVYLACVVTVGLPIMIAEILVGRKTQRSAVGAMREAIGPAWGFVGAWGVLTGFVILGYYTVVAGWTLSYITDCIGWSLNGYPEAHDGVEAFSAFAQKGPLQLTLSGLFMMATMIVVLLGVGRGIERVARMLMPALFAILVLLLAAAMTMDGTREALNHIFVPHFDRLPWTGVLEALGHAFFTLSLGMGAMITYGSYMHRRVSVVRAATLVVALDTLIALVATMIMFSVIFSKPGLSDQIGKSTVGMLFITLPDLFYSVVPMGQWLAPLFYLLVAFAALTSTISLLEVVVAYFIDERGMTRRAATIFCGLATFFLTALCGLSNGAWGRISNFEVFGEPGAKPGLFATLDHLAANWLLPIGGLLITIGVGWFMSRDAVKKELIDETAPVWFHFGLWRLFIRFVAPVAVALILIFVIFAGADFS